MPLTMADDMKNRSCNRLALFVALFGWLVPSSVLQTKPASVVGHAASDQPAASSKGTAKFIEVASALGINFEYVASHTSRKYLIETMGSGVALFDYDNDGRLDIFIVNGGPLSDPTPKGTIPQKTGAKYWNRLYHQKRDGTFTDVTEKAGVGGSGWSTSGAWVDLDGDGLLDLVVLRYLQWDFDDTWCGERREGYRAYCHPDAYRAISPLVYHSDGKGHFTEISQKAGLAEPGKGLGIALADYHRDGHLDIFVANDSMPEFLYHNKGDGIFEEVALRSGVAVDGEGHTYAGMGVDFADYNNDGLPDLVVTDLASQMYALYRNNGDGTFTYESYPSGIGRMTMTHSGWGVRFIDYDNDGWKDLLINQGHGLDTIQMTLPNFRYREAMLLARNTGKGFVDVSAEAGGIFQQAWVGRGLAIGDIDNDGRLDAVVTSNDGALYVLHNSTQTQNHWLTLLLVGHKSNRDAIGAEVKLLTAKGSQMATVTTAGSYLSSSDKRVHFGLGQETVAGTIEIHWPSGIRQTIKNVSADQILQVDEPSAGPVGKGPSK